MTTSADATPPGAAALARTLWETKYRFGRERSVGDSWRRISRAVASVEGDQAETWASAFENLLRGFRQSRSRSPAG